MQYRFDAKIDDYENENKFSVSINKLRYLAAYMGQSATACRLFHCYRRICIWEMMEQIRMMNNILAQNVGCANK